MDTLHNGKQNSREKNAAKARSIHIKTVPPEQSPVRKNAGKPPPRNAPPRKNLDYFVTRTALLE